MNEFATTIPIPTFRLKKIETYAEARFLTESSYQNAPIDQPDSITSSENSSQTVMKDLENAVESQNESLAFLSINKFSVLIKKNHQMLQELINQSIDLCLFINIVFLSYDITKHSKLYSRFGYSYC